LDRYKYGNIYAAEQISLLIFIPSIITFFLWHIINLIIDIKKGTVKISLTGLMILLSLAGLIIVNIYTYRNHPYDKSDYLRNSFILIAWVFYIWLFIKSYMYIYYFMRNSSDTVRIIFVIPIILLWSCFYVRVFSVELFSLKSLFQILIFLIIATLYLLPFIWSLFHLIYLFTHRILSVFNPGKDPVKSFLFPAAGIVLFFIFLFLMLLPNFLNARASGHLAGCESNIKNIAIALEMYAADNKGVYPPSLEYLLENRSPSGTGYMKTLPLCPASRLKYGYIVDNNPDNFTMWCNGVNTHCNAGTPDGYPQYAPGQGLICR